MLTAENRRDTIINYRRQLRGALDQELQSAYEKQIAPTVMAENTLTQWKKIIMPQDGESIREGIFESLLHFDTVLLEQNRYYAALAETYVLGPYRDGQHGYWYLTKMAMTASKLALLAEIAIYNLYPPSQQHAKGIIINEKEYSVSSELEGLEERGLFSPALRHFGSQVPVFIDQCDPQRATETEELLRRLVDEQHTMFDERSVSAVFMHRHPIGCRSGSYFRDADRIEAWMGASPANNISMISTIVHELAHSIDHPHAFGALKEIHARYQERQSLLRIEQTGYLDNLIDPKKNDQQIYRINNWFACIAAGIVQDHTSPMFINHNVHGAAELNSYLS